jgi:hypothetical protein
MGKVEDQPKKKANKGTFTKDNPGPGRPKGIPNKLTTQVKEAMELAFEGLGSVDELIEWGKTNRTEFYKLWIRLLPAKIEATGKDGEALFGPDQIVRAANEIIAARSRK